MYAKSLAVVILCTLFVLAFYLVVSFETSGIGNQTMTVPTTVSSCPASGTVCDTLTITSATLRTVNYTDELGTVNYATLSFGLEPVGGSSISSVRLYIGNLSAGAIQGPFQPGTKENENVTLPSTISISAGRTYILSIQGNYGNGLTAWASTKVTAE